MRTTFKLATVTAAMVAAVASFGVQAQSVDVKVIGQIVPAACTIDIAGGGVFNYGNIPASTLSSTDFTVLDEKSAPLSITCDADVKVAVRTTDNRAASLVPGITAGLYGQSGSNPNTNYGLGTVSGANVGGYSMSLVPDSFTANGGSVKVLGSSDAGASWAIPATGLVRNDGYYMSWGPDSAPYAPVAARTISGTLSLTAVLNKASELPVSGPVSLDGLATMELVYL